MNNQIKIPRCQHFDAESTGLTGSARTSAGWSGWCFYHGFLKANIMGVGFGGSTGCNGCFGCDVYRFEHNVKPCNVCGEGFLIPQVEPENGTHFSVCTECHSEVTDAEQAKKNKEIYKK